MDNSAPFDAMLVAEARDAPGEGEAGDWGRRRAAAAEGRLAKGQKARPHHGQAGYDMNPSLNPISKLEQQCMPKRRLALARHMQANYCCGFERTMFDYQQCWPNNSPNPKHCPSPQQG